MQPHATHKLRPFRPALTALALATVAACLGTQQARAEGDPMALGTVTVTAQKREQVAKDVPISMTVLGQQALEKADAGTMEDLQQLVPGFSMENQAGMNTLTIRGVGGGGRNIGFDPRVGVYLDGIFIGQGQALRQPLFDVEQVEVLRGPQGHLFGRNTVAGAVNITTAEPSKTLDGYVRAVLGNYGTHDAFASVSGPIGDNNLYGKISLASENHDGFITNLHNGEKLDDLQRSTVRGQLLYKPTSQLKLSLAADTSSTRSKRINGEPTTDLFQEPLLKGPLPVGKVDFNTQPHEDIDLSGVAATATYTLDSGHVLTAIVGSRHTRQVSQEDDDYTAADLFWIHYDDKFSQQSQDLRIASPNKGSVRYVAGLYHLTETANTDRAAHVGMDIATAIVRYPAIPVPVPFIAIAGTFPGAVVTNNGKIDTDTTALYGALDVDVASGLTLNLGARYTHESKKLLFNLDGSQSGNFGIGSLNNYRDSRSESKVSPTVGATYALSQQQNVYAKFSRGFKSGGWNVEFLDQLNAKNPAFDTETVDGIELGTKGSLAAGSVNYSLAAYSSKFKNFQVFQFVPISASATSIQLRNAAEAKSEGLEGSTTVRVARNFDVGFSFASGKATFTRFNTCSPLVDCTGHRLPYAPDFTAALTADYKLNVPSLGGKLDLYGEYSYHGSTYMGPENFADSQAMPSRTQVNVRASYAPTDSHWTVSLWSKNLTDAHTVTAKGRDFLGTEFGRRMDPRTFGVEVKFSLD